MKKIISVFLSLFILMSMAIPASARDYMGAGEDSSSQTTDEAENSNEFADDPYTIGKASFDATLELPPLKTATFKSNVIRDIPLAKSVTLITETIPGIIITEFYEGYFVIQDTKAKKYGIVDSDKDMTDIFPPIYDDISPVATNLFAVKKNGKYGVVGKDGKEIIPFKYDQIMSRSWDNFIIASGEANTDIYSMDGKRLLFSTTLTTLRSSDNKDVINFMHAATPATNHQEYTEIINLKTGKRVNIDGYACDDGERFIIDKDSSGNNLVVDYNGRIVGRPDNKWKTVEPANFNNVLLGTSEFNDGYLIDFNGNVIYPKRVSIEGSYENKLLLVYTRDYDTQNHYIVLDSNLAEVVTMDDNGHKTIDMYGNIVQKNENDSWKYISLLDKKVLIEGSGGMWDLTGFDKNGTAMSASARKSAILFNKNGTALVPASKKYEYFTFGTTRTGANVAVAQKNFSFDYNGNVITAGVDVYQINY